MEHSIYPQASAELARKRRELAPATLDAFKAFSAQVFADGALAGQDQAIDRGRGGARHAVPVLHPRPHRGRAQARRQRAGNHGGHLGRRGDARGWRLCALGAGPRHHAPGACSVTLMPGENTREYTLCRRLRQHPRCDRRHAVARDRGYLRQARIPQSLRLDQGAHRQIHDRARRTRGSAQARRHHRRGHQRQHRQCPGDGRRGQGLPHAGGDAGRAVQRARGDLARLWRRGAVLWALPRR